MTSIMLINYHFYVPINYHFYVKMAQWFLRKASFHLQMTLGQSQEMTLTLNTHIPSLNSVICLYLATFWSQAARNDLDLEYSHTFINSVICLYLPTFWSQAARNDLDLEYSHTFINSVICLYLPTFWSQAAIVSEKYTVFTFFYRKAYVTIFDLALK